MDDLAHNLADKTYMLVCERLENIYSQYNPRETIINVILSLKHFSFSISHEGRLNFPAIIYMAVTTANRLYFAVGVATRYLESVVYF